MERNLFESPNTDSLTLLDLNERIGAAITADRTLHDVWVTAETGDVRISGGHCYLELIQKDPDTARPIARLRAIIWASQYARIDAELMSATGNHLASDLKVMVRMTVNFHTAFGLSGVISAINPDFTCGDLQRRRRLMIKRLTEEGIIDMNRTLPWPDTALRVAVISAHGAAGFGDFVTHLYHNTPRLNFSTTLFPATMQGENAPADIISALENIAADIDSFDCVVIIRGGGATGDLASFDDYALAANIAQFPLPVIVGIGHERDVTILDFVASIRVKTPTAAAEWLINHNNEALLRICDIATEIVNCAQSKVAGGKQQLAYYQGLLPTLSKAIYQRASQYLEATAPHAIRTEASRIVKSHSDRLNAMNNLIEALSPAAVLRRGYSICRHNGHAITDASVLAAGDKLTITFSNGTAEATTSLTKN